MTSSTSKTPAAATPVGMPMLSRGKHSRPEQGACLMEYVSVLSGEAFSDRPACVDRLLVRLAWEINDRSAEVLLGYLPTLGPRLIGTATDNPMAAPTIVSACAGYASNVLDG